MLSARASEAEAGLPFAAVIDLLDGVTDEELDLAARRRSGTRSTWRSTARSRSGSPAEPQAICARPADGAAVARAGGELLVAIDDVQWLDRASDDALAYAVRRLADEPVTFLLARRPGERSALEGAFPRDGPRR